MALSRSQVLVNVAKTNAGGEKGRIFCAYHKIAVLSDYLEVCALHRTMHLLCSSVI